MVEREESGVRSAPPITEEAEAWIAGELSSEDYYRIARERQHPIAQAEVTAKLAEAYKPFYISSLLRLAGRTAIKLFKS